MAKASIDQLNNKSSETAVEVRTKNQDSSGSVDSGHYAEPGVVNDFSSADNVPSEDSDALMYVCTSAGLTRLYRIDGDGSVQIVLTGATSGTYTFDSSAPDLMAEVLEDGSVTLVEVE